MTQEEIHSLAISYSDSEEESDDSDTEKAGEISVTPATKEYLVHLLKSSNFNWFELVSQAQSSTVEYNLCKSPSMALMKRKWN